LTLSPARLVIYSSLLRHPCNAKPSVVADIGLRLQEGIQELKLDQQLAPTREAITRSFAVGSTNLRKAMEGVGRWARDASTSSASLNELLNGGRPVSRPISRPSTPPIEITIADVDEKPEKPPPPTRQPPSQLRQLSLPLSPRLMAEASNAGAKVTSTSTAAANAVWGGIGSLWSARPVKLTLPRLGKDTAPPDSAASAAFEGINIDSPPIRDLDEHPRSPYPTITADTP
jgi:hypothetical protein